MVPRSGLVPPIRSLISLAIVAGTAGVARADKMVYGTPDGRFTVEGRLTVRTASEILFLACDGRMHLVNPSRVVELEETQEKPKPLSKEEMIAELRREFGSRFRVFSTNRYVICYNSDPDFARSCGRLFERLHGAFANYFQKAGFQVQPNEYPLVAIVFGDEKEFLAYATRELGEDMARNVIGYYSFLSNRMVLFDMQARAGRAGLGNVARKTPSGPRSIDAYTEANIATVIHEAAHQLAYNTGFHQRFSDNPLWLAEGMGMFFEAPNRQSANWSGIGEINRPRLALFRDQHLVPGGNRVDILKLIQDDELLRDKKTALVGYADSWALTYFLIKTHREQYYEYLRILAKKPPLAQDGPNQRLADFKAAFGDDVAQLEEDFVRYIRTLPAR